MIKKATTHLIIAAISCSMLNIQAMKKKKICCFNSSRNQIKRTENIVTNQSDLLKAAKYATEFFNGENSHEEVNSNHLNKFISPKEAQKTLKFIIDSIKKKENVLSHNFINKNFSFVKWNADKEVEKSSQNIRLTRYGLYRFPGSYKKTEKHPHALYASSSVSFLNSFSLKENIELSKIKKTILDDHFHKNKPFRFGKQNILTGILEQPEFKKHVTPLVWVSKNALNESLCQGGVYIDMPNGKSRLFNVDSCNNVLHDRKGVTFEDQERYWLFREVEKNNNPEDDRYHKLLDLKLVAFAHDPKTLGLGKTILIRYTNTKTKKKEILVGILADTGGAFVENLHQIDLFCGLFENRKTLIDFANKFPPTVEIYFLKKKP